MRKTLNIARHINVLNLILLAAVGLMINYMALPMLKADKSFPPPVQKNLPADEEEGDNGDGKKAVSPLDYSVIAEENLFHPERKIPVEKKEEAPLPKPEFVLYGVMTADDGAIVYMEDKKAPHSTPGRGKRQLALRKDDTLSGFRVAEIDEDKVVMVRGEERLTVLVNEKGKDRGKGAASAAVVPVLPKTPAQPPGPAPVHQRPPLATPRPAGIKQP